MDKSVAKIVEDIARNGDRIGFRATDEEKIKTIWGGLGNRAGLHSFAYDLIDEKWKKSGPRFSKKLAKLTGGTIIVLEFRSITRDRGRWIPVREFVV